MGERAHIPILTKCLVARRQLRDFGVETRRRPGQTLSSYHEELVHQLKGCMGLLSVSQLQLDHDPALGLRKLRVDETGEPIGFIPAETDHRYLVYRERAAHLQKTVGRKPGAEKTVTTKGSDVWLMKKFRRLEGPKKRKQKIPGRAFPKSKRKFGC